MITTTTTTIWAMDRILTPKGHFGLGLFSSSVFVFFGFSEKSTIQYFDFTFYTMYICFVHAGEINLSLNLTIFVSWFLGPFSWTFFLDLLLGLCCPKQAENITGHRLLSRILH
jgi:hypothetical protein